MYQIDASVISQVLLQLLVLAILVEACVEVVKGIVPDRYLTPQLKKQMALGVGMLIALASPYTLFPGGPVAFQVVGKVLAGALLGRGSNVIHDLLRILRGYSEQVVSKARSLGL